MLIEVAWLWECLPTSYNSTTSTLNILLTYNAEYCYQNMILKIITLQGSQSNPCSAWIHHRFILYLQVPFRSRRIGVIPNYLIIYIRFSLITKNSASIDSSCNWDINVLIFIIYTYIVLRLNWKNWSIYCACVNILLLFGQWILS